MKSEMIPYRMEESYTIKMYKSELLVTSWKWLSGFTYGIGVADVEDRSVINTQNIKNITDMNLCVSKVVMNTIGSVCGMRKLKSEIRIWKKKKSLLNNWYTYSPVLSS